MVAWIFTSGILHIGLEEMYKFGFFARKEFVFSFQEDLHYCMTLSFENFSVMAKTTLFPCHVVISH